MPGSGEDVRGARPRQLPVAHVAVPRPLQRHRRALQRRDGLRAARRRQQRAAVRRAGRSGPSGCRGSASARPARTGRWTRSSGATGAASNRATRTGICRSTFTTARSSRSASTRTSRRSARRSPSTARAACGSIPGRYEFNEWFVLWNTNNCGAGSRSRAAYSDRRLLRRLPARLHLRPGGPGQRALQRLGQPADQRHRAVDRRVRLDAGDEPRQLQLQHEDVRERAAAVQHRLAAAGARTCASTSSTARSATSSSSTTSGTTSGPTRSIGRSSPR